MKLSELISVHGGMVCVFDFDEYTMYLEEVYFGSSMVLLDHPGEVSIPIQGTRVI